MKGVSVVCYDDGVLQALIDGELSGEKEITVKRHLTDCSRCCAALQSIKENADFVNGKIAAYLYALDPANEQATAPAPGSIYPAPKGRALFAGHRPVREKNGYHSNGENFFMRRYRKLAATAVAVMIIALGFGFEPVRTFAGNMLNVFRVEQVKTITLSQEDIAAIEKAVKEGAGRIDLADFGQVTFSGNNTPRDVTLDEARAALDFRLELPAWLPDGLTLQKMQAFSASEAAFTLDVNNTNKVLKSLGSTSLLPAGLDGKTFTCRMPSVVKAVFAGSGGYSMALGQSRSPELIVPDGADVGAVRDALLSLPFLPDSLRSQLASIDDWQHTFLVPDVEGSSSEIRVAGVQGVFFTPPAGERSHARPASGQSTLIWQKEGVVYALHGSMTLEQALQTANSMR
ncbi:MAG: zf-HC2 domain-containing protein [Firmicutes bacterium]|nr:zf-HC2 domain-containing protein [Bacillota bacterium]